MARLFHDSDQIENRLAWVIIELAGGDAYDPANLWIGNGSRVSVSHATLRQGAGFGLELEPRVNVAFSENRLIDNAAGAATVDVEVAGMLDAASDYSGNDVDVVELTNAGDVEIAQTWPAANVDYLIADSVRVYEHLTIAAGATLRFAQDTSMVVNGGTYAGALTAQGTAGAPIRLTGEQATPGYWGHLSFWNSDAAGNVLDYVTVEYGGGDAYDPTNVLLEAGSSVSVTHSAIEHSGGWGIWVDCDTTVNGDVETSNTFTGNASGSVGWESGC